MAKVPGHIGMPIIGDRSLEFANDSLKFVNNHIQKYGRIFQSRLLNRQTIFLASYDAVQQLLNDTNGTYDMEYRYKALWGENILHYNVTSELITDKEATRVKAVLGKCLDPDQLARLCGPMIHKILENLLGSLEHEKEVPLYTKFKQVASYITVCLFLGLDPGSTHEIDSIIELTTEHWHGLISIPVSASFTGWSTTFGKAIKAKDELIDRIEELLCRFDKNEFNQTISNAGFKSREELRNHILLFVSALPPKAVASLLASTFIELGKTGHARYVDIARNDLDLLNAITTEIERLHPPFIGGKRQAIKGGVISGFTIPKGCSLLYLTHAAHRDPAAFPNPDQFLPERCSNNRKIWTFGGGRRACVGRTLMKMMLQETISYVIKNYDWQFQSDVCNIKYKTLPVYRPDKEFYVKFTRRDNP
ncbi:uncharacterized protein TRIADDRAFT_60776 [Trichoplax adhaerens]|uniref:Cytochrome P450 n=1 Tax=Trichoplax adhaerens TaxID=10228 RepID=B3S8X4_TRIAD|nr:hypothetical protein TRIADDRAFT_60776 [Trichoplax adhaerens]EDV20846.1 hypothetical protein TRIADDRAFT_60776 [Trichoplax adhaerens]|eukprot:XP_002116787.1 hypothetical protein TRIADDRAFT_60776 [Trichoplax adhaerens]